MRTILKIFLVAVLSFSFASAEIKVGDQFLYTYKQKEYGIFTIKKKIKNGFVTDTIEIIDPRKNFPAKIVLIIEKYHDTKHQGIYEIKTFIDGRVGNKFLVKEFEDGTLQRGGFRVDTGEFILFNYSKLIKI